MTIDQWLTVIAAIGGLLFVVSTTSLGFTIRIAMRWAGVELRQQQIIKDFDQHLVDSQKRIDVLYDSIKNDRMATNERLTFLERDRMHAS